MIGAMASAIDGYTWVAPNLMAWSRFHSFGSIAMTFFAPLMTAPCSALMPMPPTPTITTVSPGCTSATLVAGPKPVGSAQPMMAADSNGMSGVDLDDGVLVHGRVRRERAEQVHRRDLGASGVYARRAVGDGLAAEQHCAAIAQRPEALQAWLALAAGRDETRGLVALGK